MGREIRKVPKDWQHPKETHMNGFTGRLEERFRPMHDGRNYHEKAQEWVDECAKWAAGERPEYAGDDAPPYFWEWAGMPPDREMHMLVDVPDEERTHFMLYETTSEGTPHHDCPVFDNIDDLCAWAEKNATTFARFTATAEEWKRMLTSGFVMTVDPDNPNIAYL